MTMQTGAGPGQSSGRQSLIDRDSHFNGAYTTPNDLRIEGRYEGEIDCQGTVVVAEGADVNARISAVNVSVAGHLQGEIGCRGRFEILASGRVGGRVLAGTIVVHEGARYEGELRMRRDEASDPNARQSGARPTAPPARRRGGAFEGSEVPAFPTSGARANGRPQAEENAPLPQETGNRE